MTGDAHVLAGASFDALWEQLRPVGRDPRTGGYRRFAWSAADREARNWFRQAAATRGMPVEMDRNGNLWAWWGDPQPRSVVTGSHLDSVPNGGPFDGPLGLVSAFAAIDVLQLRAIGSWGSSKQPATRDRTLEPERARDDVSPEAKTAPVGRGVFAETAEPAASPESAEHRRPIAVVCFADEEGARFGVACTGSRLLTGALDPDRARSLTDADGITLADAMRSNGHDPDRLGRDDEALERIGCFVELHLEQGRALADLDWPVAVGAAIWPHGRWRFDFAGRADHAGTTRLTDRNDAMVVFAQAVLDARAHAARLEALATFGKVLVEPNATNAIPARVCAWLDARGPDEPTVEKVVAALTDATGATVKRESWTPAVEFDPTLRNQIAAVVAQMTRPATAQEKDGADVAPAVPSLPTGAGHDAGVLAAEVPTAMLFVRNPTGVSHSPYEHADRADCLAGIVALAAVLDDLASR